MSQSFGAERAPVTQWTDDALVEELTSLARSLAYPTLSLSARSYSAEIAEVKREIWERAGYKGAGGYLEILAMQVGSSFSNPLLDAQSHREKIEEEKEKLKALLKQARESKKTSKE